MKTTQPAAKTVEHEPGTIPVDVRQPLKPTRALSITHTKHGQIIIQDLTSSLPTLFAPTTGLAIEAATKLIDATPVPPVLYTLKKENLLGTHLTATDKEGKVVAEWKNPILSFHASKVSIKFLGEEQKTVDVNPIGHDKISESFTFNNKNYIWESEFAHHQHKHLYVVVEPTTATAVAPAESSTSTPPTPSAPIHKVALEIARYTQKHVHGHGHAGGKEGLLVLNAGEIEEVVGVLTLCAMLEQLHKEERFERAYDNVVGIVA